MGGLFIGAPSTIVPALDCRKERAAEIVKGVASHPLVQAFKLGAWVGTLRPGLNLYMEEILPYLNGKMVIYDHQKGGTDIPDLAGDALRDLADAGVDAVILFPFGGGKTQEVWTKTAMELGLTVLIGGEMTQPEFLWSQGGYIHDDAPERMYRRGVQHGVKNFVVPGNKPESVMKYGSIILDELEEVGGDPEEISLFAPGFVRQGGEISDTAKVAGKRWHAIVGTALVKAEDIEAAINDLTSQISVA